MSFYSVEPLDDEHGLLGGASDSVCPLVQQLILSLGDSMRADWAQHSVTLRELAARAQSSRTTEPQVWNRRVARTEALIERLDARVEADLEQYDLRTFPRTTAGMRQASHIRAARARYERARCVMSWGRMWELGFTPAAQLTYGCAAQHALYSLSRALDELAAASEPEPRRVVITREYPPPVAEANRAVLALVESLL